jgi:glycosyltransferase involved in cell wall biosynthesis
MSQRPREAPVTPSTAGPRVSIGLPVYNGERFVEEALASLLGQTFDDLEVIISDNASTDATGAICRAIAARDERVRYYRNRENIGAAPNFNRVLTYARGPYFKWTAHDDVCCPDFLLRCVEVLDRDPSVVLSYPSALDIDEDGRVMGPCDQDADFGGDRAHERFRNVMRTSHAYTAIFGVVRVDALRHIPMRSYPAADTVRLAELALHGRLHRVREELFLHREHADRGYYVASRSSDDMRAWWDPSARSTLLPWWRRLAGYVGAANRAPISLGERLRCHLETLRWAGYRHRPLLREVGQLVSLRRSRPNAERPPTAVAPGTEVHGAGPVRDGAPHV